MGPIEKQARETCRAVLDRIDGHLAKHPMGETYFGSKSADNPMVVINLRKGRLIRPKTLDRIVAYIDARERAIEEEAAKEDSEAGL